MKTLKNIGLISLVSLGLLSCEAEKIDTVIANGSTKGEAVLRFDLGGQTRIARGSNVSITTAPGYIVLTAVVKDIYSQFEPVTLTISFTNNLTGSSPSLEEGEYQTAIGKVDTTAPKYVSAILNYYDSTLIYSTAVGDTPENYYLDRGTFVVEHINAAAQQFEGAFRFDMYTSQTGAVAKINLENGFYKYVNY